MGGQALGPTGHLERLAELLELGGREGEIWTTLAPKHFDPIYMRIVKPNGREVLAFASTFRTLVSRGLLVRDRERNALGGFTYRTVGEPT